MLRRADALRVLCALEELAFINASIPISQFPRSQQIRHLGLKAANLEELEPKAKPLLSETAYSYYASGSESQWTLQENRNAFQRLRLLPRILHDVSNIDISCNLFGQPLSMPVLIAPMAMQRLCHPDGELAMAKAAYTSGTTMILSTMATSSIEEVAATQCSSLWFQIYVLTRRDVTELMIQQAEQLGYKALVVTVDAPILGRRESDERLKFSLPSNLSLKNLELMEAAAGQTDDVQGDGSKFQKHFTTIIDPALTWEFIPWIKSKTRLPVLVKGVLAPCDARKAIELGVDGIIVSNHGGRQLDYAPAAIDVLPHIMTAVQGQVPVLIDGGIRRGTDILKCLSLGANAVLLGRPLLWALTLGGQGGVEEALDMVRRELEMGMALLGCAKLNELNADFVVPPADWPARIPAGRL